MRSETVRGKAALASALGALLLSGCLDYAVQPQTRTGTFVDLRDGTGYRTIAIGSQTWMAQNLAHAAQGRCYEGLESECALFGRLYTWSEAAGLPAACDTSSDTAACALPAGSRGICPAGWHLPTDGEWAILSGFVGGDANALKALSMGGDGATGFEVLAAGLEDTDGVFKYKGTYADFWTASTKRPNLAWEWYFEAKDPSVTRLAVSRRRSLSVRCLQD